MFHPGHRRSIFCFYAGSAAQADEVKFQREVHEQLQEVHHDVKSLRAGVETP